MKPLWCWLSLFSETLQVGSLLLQPRNCATFKTIDHCQQECGIWKVKFCRLKDHGFPRQMLVTLSDQWQHQMTHKRAVQGGTEQTRGKTNPIHSPWTWKPDSGVTGVFWRESWLWHHMIGWLHPYKASALHGTCSHDSVAIASKTETVATAPGFLTIVMHC